MTTTTDLADFGFVQLEELRDILEEWLENGLPDMFEDRGVVPMFNSHSGFVFLANSEYQACLINPELGSLEIWHYTPYSGHEGFASDLLESYKTDSDVWHDEDVEYLRNMGILDDEISDDDENGGE